jgi:hypothetical protein
VRYAECKKVIIFAVAAVANTKVVIIVGNTAQVAVAFQ